MTREEFKKYWSQMPVYGQKIGDRIGGTNDQPIIQMADERHDGFDFYEPDDVHTDVPLTDYSLAFDQSTLGTIGNILLPEKRVMKESDKYITMSAKDASFIPDNMERAPRSETAVIDITESSSTYTVTEYSLGMLVDDRTIANQDQPFNVLMDATNALTRIIMLNREKKQADQLLSATVFSGYTAALTANTTMWDAESSTPWNQADDARESIRQSSLIKMNKCAMGPAVWKVLKRHPQMLAYLNGSATQAGMISKQVAASIFEVDEVLVGETAYNTANYAQTASISDVWGKYALFAYVDPNAGLYSPTLGLTFVLDGMRVETYRVPSKRSTMIVVTDIFAPKVTNAAAGYLYSTVIS